MISETQKAYLAGFWDADGHIGIHKRGPTYVPVLSCCNTNEAIINNILALLDEAGIKYYVRYDDRGDRTNAKPAWHVQVDGRPRAVGLLELLTPYLVGKRPQAIVVSDWCQLPRTRGKKPEGYSEMIDTIKALNARGRVK